MNEGYPIKKIDVRHNGEAASAYGIRAVPTFVYLKYDGGQTRQVGSQSKSTLQNMFQ
jgi:predicted DsbA family dithiol-disulfide isomerase